MTNVLYITILTVGIAVPGPKKLVLPKLKLLLMAKFGKVV